MFSKILVICTGNICRSPMGEALLAARWAGGNRSVRSAGVGALVGRPAEPHAIDVMREHDIDMTAHRARQLDAAMVREADLLLTMEPEHSEWILSLVPTARGKVHLITRFSGGEHVHDPYMQGRVIYEDTYAVLDASITQWLKRI